MANELVSSSDSELMAMLSQNEVGAWSELIKRYNKIVYSIAYQILRDRYDAEDAMQNTFVRLKIYSSNYDASQPLQPWLAKMAGGEALRIYQKRKINNKKESVRMDAKPISLPSKVSEAPNQVDAIEMGQLLSSAMNQLPDSSRVALTLYYGSGLTQAEIANQLGVSQVSISERIKTGIDKLKIILKKSGFGTFALTPVFFCENVCVYSPSSDFLQQLSVKLPSEALINSMVNSKPFLFASSSSKFSIYSALKWFLLLSLMPLIYFVCSHLAKDNALSKNYNENHAKTINVKNSHAAQQINFSETQPFFYKWGKIQKDIDKPNDLVEGWILHRGESGNWKSHTNNKGDTIFSRDSKVQNSRDGIFLGSYQKPSYFTGTIKYFSDQSKFGMIMNTSINTGEKLTQLNSDNNKFYNVAGHYSELGTIHGNKNDEIEFKVFIWKTPKKWFSASIVNGVGGDTCHFLPSSLTHVNEGFNFGIFSDSKIEVINVKHCELGDNWLPTNEAALSAFKENLPTDESSEFKVIQKQLK